MKDKSWRKWFLLVGLALAVFTIPISTASSAPAERVVHIDASRFAYNPAKISVNPGDRVTIEMAAADVVHGLAIDGYNLSLTAEPGQPTSLTFVAGRPGVYRFRCNVTCGNMHPFMTGKLYVGANTLLLRAIALMGLALLAVVWSAQR